MKLDNLDQDQKRGDHLCVALSLSAILLVEILVSLLFPAYGASFQSGVFIAVNAVLFIAYLIAAVKLWKMTFETYNGMVVAAPVLLAVANLLWYLSWGAVHASNIDNGFIK